MANSTIRAIQIQGDKASPVVTGTERIPKPVAQGEQILVQVRAAGIIADEVGWPELWEAPHRVPGHEISGIIAGFGPAYHGQLKVGQEVFGFLGTDGIGEGQAEYAIALATEIVPKPKNIQHDQAAVLPIPILTAQQALFDHAKLQPGMSLLITGASGAVGLLAVQLAAQVQDVKIIALASAKHHEALRRFGAAKCLDYHDESWHTEVKDVDVVFDTVGGSVLHRSWELVRSNDVIVTVADPIPPWAFGKGPAEEASSHPEVRHIYFILSPNAEKLQDAANKLEDGRLESLKAQSFTIDQAVEAWSYARQRGRDAKAVLVFEGT